MLLLNEVFYLNRLTSFSSGKWEEKSQCRDFVKEKAMERNGLAKTSPSTQRARAHRSKQRWRESPQQGIRDHALSSLLALEEVFLLCFTFFPLSPYFLSMVGIQWMNHQAKSPPAPKPTSTLSHCKTCSKLSSKLVSLPLSDS